MTGFSLIVTTYRRNEDVLRFLKSVAGSTYDFRVEIILVDQNEDAALKNEFEILNLSSVTLDYYTIPRTSLSKARQFGMEKATETIIAFPDDDCWYEPDTLKHVHTNFDEDKDMGIVLANWVEHPFTDNQKHNITLVNIRRFNTVPLSSICLFIKRSIIEAINGFDERLGLGTPFSGGEDFDIVMRSSKYGKIQFDPLAKVHHLYDKNRSKDFQLAFNREKGTGALYVKHKMPILVIVRGILSPLYFSFKKLTMFPLYILIGRLSGMIIWKLKYRN
jgi:GT2 family glycosyltransferase